MTRSILSALSGFPEVPYDVGYVWRFGNEDAPHDALPIEAALSRTIEHVRSELPRLAGVKENASGFVEKTVGNTLRVDFVRAIYPEAKYVYVLRNGLDVVESAIRSWKARPSIPYLLRKSRTFSWRRAPRYATRYARSTATRILGLSKTVKTWGPQYPGIHEDVKLLPLSEVCAKQWAASVESLHGALPYFKADQLLVLRFEEMVSEPRRAGERLASFLTMRSQLEAEEVVTSIMDRSSLNRGPLENEARVREIVSHAMDIWGYTT